MKVVKFIIDNYKALRGHHEFTPAGSNFILVGANGQGKTSAGRALIDVVTKKLPSKPVTEGENAGYIEYQFDNGQKLLCKLTEDGSSKIELITADGLKVATPKELFKKLAGNAMEFDIDDFLAMAPKPRREMLEKLAGLDFTQINKEEAALMEARRETKADAKAAQARVVPYEAALADMEDVDTTEILARIKEANDQNMAIERVQTGIKQRDMKIGELQSQIAKLQEEAATLKGDIDKGYEWLSTNDPVEENETIRMNSLIENADKIKDAKRAKQDDIAFQQLDAMARDLDDQIQSLREKKESIIKSSPLPADGLSFDPDGDGLLLDGVPFESNQIAASKKLIAAIQLATSMLGEIRYLHFDGATLDKNNCDAILAWAEKHDLQLCIERPLWEGGDGVKMEIIDQTATPDQPIKKSNTKAKVEAPAKAEPQTTISNHTKKALPWE